MASAYLSLFFCVMRNGYLGAAEEKQELNKAKHHETFFVNCFIIKYLY